MLALIRFLTKIFRANQEPHTIPASEAKKMWEDRRHMKTSQAGLDLIESFEGFKAAPYLDSKGIPTIGIGSTHYEDNTAVTMDDQAISKDRAYQLLSYHLSKEESTLNHAITVDLNQNQFDALSCFTYNVGEGNFLASTLLKDVNAGNFGDAADQFLRWDKAGGVELAGLTRRRQAERDLFLS